jgi:F-box protein 21
MRNCFIGQAILHEPHESLPLISSAIFCSLAARVGLSAQSCLFPGHVHVAVFLEPHPALGDNDVLLSGEDKRVDIMYLDPYGADREVSEDFLRSLVNSFGWRYHARLFLSPTRPWSLMMRMAHNVKATLQHETLVSDQDDPYASPVDATRPVSGSSVVNREAAEYSRLWLRVMLYRPGTPEWKEVLRHLLDVILNQRDSKWRHDLWLVRKYLYPMFDNLNPLNIVLLDGIPGGPRTAVDTYTNMDRESRVIPKKRCEGSNSIYRIGQVVYNERLNYAAIVIGWGPSVDEIKAGVGEGVRVPEKWYNLLWVFSFSFFIPASSQLDRKA